jgi:phage N-6-adenine-methyltransferase
MLRDGGAGTALVPASAGELVHYNPVAGLDRIAVLEAAERRFRQAKDTTELFRAIEAKLRAQREFVLWWDAQEKQQGARGLAGPGRGHKGEKTAFQSGDAVLIAGRNGLPNRTTISRWRRLFEDARDFEKTLADAKRRCLRVCEHGRDTSRGGWGSGDDQWHTPAKYVQAVRRVLGGIDVDPASNEVAQQTVRAKRYYTHENDGLLHQWHGKVFMNPPYTRRVVSRFVEKLIEEFEAGRTVEAILLAHAFTDTHWFVAAARRCQSICLTNGRIHFTKPEDGITASPCWGQSFIYFGPNRDRFETEFSQFGWCVRLSRPYCGDNTQKPSCKTSPTKSNKI